MTSRSGSSQRTARTRASNWTNVKAWPTCVVSYGVTPHTYSFTGPSGTGWRVADSVSDSRTATSAGLSLQSVSVLTFRAGDPDRPRGHALLFFRDGDDPDAVWATYLVVAPIQMDLGKYIPAAFASQLAGQLGAAGRSAYPLPPVPEKIEGGLAWLERLASLRGDDLLDGGTLRMSDPLYAMQAVSDTGTQYAESCSQFIGAEPTEELPAAASSEAASNVNV